jgi:outer membrane protein TolC
MTRNAGSSVAALLAAAALAAAAGCASFPPGRSVDNAVSPAPGSPWQPPAQARLPPPAPPPAPAIPPEYLEKGATLSLAQVLDVALRNNPVTRSAWFQAKSAAADLGSKRSEFFPVLEIDGSLTRQKQAALGGRSIFLQTTYGPSASLTWLLLDFGGRSADVEEARRVLFAADYAHNAAIQNVSLQVEQAYYQYLNTKALEVAAQASLKAARETRAASDERHRAGVATIADVLQARTAFSQAELALESVQGQIQTLRGSLATAMGVSANIPVEAGELPDKVRVEEVGETVDQLIEKAESQRPDLAAARLTALSAQSHIQSVRAQGLPTLFASGTLNRMYFYKSPTVPYADVYTGTILLRIPVFTGWKSSYDVLKAREDSEAAKAQVETLTDQVILQVWTSYYNLKTAAQQVKTARELFASARQSEEVALGRYKAGVGSILDLLTAQTAFANARAQEVQARASWFLAMAQLAHDTGALAPAVGAPAATSSTPKGNTGTP